MLRSSLLKTSSEADRTAESVTRRLFSLGPRPESRQGATEGEPTPKEDPFHRIKCRSDPQKPVGSEKSPKEQTPAWPGGVSPLGGWGFVDGSGGDRSARNGAETVQGRIGSGSGGRESARGERQAGRGSLEGPGLPRATAGGPNSSGSSKGTRRLLSQASCRESSPGLAVSSMDCLGFSNGNSAVAGDRGHQDRWVPQQPPCPCWGSPRGRTGLLRG